MLLNRLKILLILFVLAFLSVLLWQNQELLALKLLCSDVNQSCFYQTPQLPLALWMSVFTLAGVITSLIWQSLNYLSTKGSSQNRSSASTRYASEVENIPTSSQTTTKFTNTQPSNQSKQPLNRSSVETKTKDNSPSTNFTERSDWEEENRHDDWDTEESNQEKTTKQSASKQIKENKRQKLSKDSATTQSSDHTYSYKFPPNNQNKDQKVDRVYDANYRVIDPSPKINTHERIETSQDDDEEWI